MNKYKSKILLGPVTGENINVLYQNYCTLLYQKFQFYSHFGKSGLDYELHCKI